MTKTKDSRGISWGGARTAAAGISWDAARANATRAIAAAGALALAAPLVLGGHQPVHLLKISDGSALTSVIVRDVAGMEGAAERTVAELGGTVGRHIGIIDGFVANVPADQVGQLQQTPGVASVSPNNSVRLMSVNTGSYDATNDPHSMYRTTLDSGAQNFWKSGYTGQGVDVAVIDSGVAPVDGLTAPGKVLNGPDLSFESNSPSLAFVDTFGHGTHMSGIIAGRDDEVAPGKYAGNSNDFIGMAPDARIVSIKVADSNGSTDVSQMLAAIDWVVQHKDDPGMNIRVLNLSFGTDSTQDYQHDPLAYAAEMAWRNGIVVVAAAGNAGYATGKKAPGLTDPANDPYVIAVGASDTKGTPMLADDTVADFSSSAASNKDRLPDVVAPGTSIASLRVLGSHADEAYASTGAVTDRLFRGSGTSQAAAVVSGAAALILSQRPTATPDQVKALLTSTADKLPNVPVVSQGNGAMDLDQVLGAATNPKAKQTWAKSTGDGTIEGARGSSHIVDDSGVALTGEQDVFGNKLDAKKLADQTKKGTAWNGATWNGSSWLSSDPAAAPSGQPSSVPAAGTTSGSTGLTGHSWSGHSWSGHSWSDYDWSGHSWSGHSWSGHSWSGHSWSGHSWSDSSWSDGSWS
jgi:serine protease AprX